MISINETHISEYKDASPYPHVLLDDCLSLSQYRKISDQFYSFEDRIWIENGVEFDSEYGNKRQIYDTEYMPIDIANLVEFLSGKQFISQLEKMTNLEIKCANLYGGGMNMYSSGTQLRPHVDFNFNSQINAYRCINLLYYINSEDLVGGNLELWDLDQKNKSVIEPISNRMVIFETNSKTLHGVTLIKKGYRRSISIYYYTDNPSQQLNTKPHRTLWRDNE